MGEFPDNILNGVRFLSATFLVLLSNNAECVTASSQYLQSKPDFYIKDRVSSRKVRSIRFNSPVDCTLYSELVVSVSLLVFNVFFTAVNSLAFSLCTLLTLDAEFLFSHAMWSKTKLTALFLPLNGSTSLYLNGVVVIKERYLLSPYVGSTRGPHSSKCKVAFCLLFISSPFEAAFVCSKHTHTDQSRSARYLHGSYRNTFSMSYIV